jgi:hypothetical protein
MLGLFGIFGRSQEMQGLDDAFRAVGLHPRAVPDAVKLTVLKQLKETRGRSVSDPHARTAAAELLGYCVLGEQDFARSNDPNRTSAVEARLVAAIESGVGQDARLVLLTLHAGLTNPSVIDRYGLAVAR